MEELLTLPEAAVQFGRSREALYKAVLRGDIIPAKRYPRTILLRPSDVAAYVAKPIPRPGRPKKIPTL